MKYLRYIWACIRFEIQWWKWMLGYPSMIKLIITGVDSESRKRIYKRYTQTAPDAPKREDYWA